MGYRKIRRFSKTWLTLLIVSTNAWSDTTLCAGLRQLTTPSYTIVNTQHTGAYCFVEGVIPHTIRFWMWLPDDWNERTVMRGGGGYAGHQPRIDPVDPLRDQGYAITTTDTGHDARTHPLASFAYNNRAQEIDYAYRAVHLTATTTKALIARYYQKASKYDYWHGCSTGGRQGLMSAQRFPQDFDGILANAPVLDFSNTQISGVWAARIMHNSTLTPEKVRAVGREVYAACDALDGLSDGLIRDPRRCSFNVLNDMPRCTDDNAPDCLTTLEAEAMSAIYKGVQSQGKTYFPGQPLGAELPGRFSTPPFDQSGWNLWYFGIGERTPLLEAFGVSFMRYLAFPVDNPDWQLADFDFDADPYRMNEIRQVLDAVDPNLSAFKDRQGRMITFHGWSDTALNPMMAVNYYERVASLDADVRDYYRLYMVPGMFHCRGGRGITHLDPFENLVQWVEQGKAPDALVGEQRTPDGQVTMTRKVCPYPEVAVYKGADPNIASSFTCAAPPDA